MRNSTHSAAQSTVINQLSEHSGGGQPHEVQADCPFCCTSVSKVNEAVDSRGPKMERVHKKSS